MSRVRAIAPRPIEILKINNPSIYLKIKFFIKDIIIQIYITSFSKYSYNHNKHEKYSINYFSDFPFIF